MKCCQSLCPLRINDLPVHRGRCLLAHPLNLPQSISEGKRAFRGILVKEELECDSQPISSLCSRQQWNMVSKDTVDFQHQCILHSVGFAGSDPQNPIIASAENVGGGLCHPGVRGGGGKLVGWGGGEGSEGMEEETSFPLPFLVGGFFDLVSFATHSARAVRTIASRASTVSMRGWASLKPNASAIGCNPVMMGLEDFFESRSPAFLADVVASAA